MAVQAKTYVIKTGTAPGDDSGGYTLAKLKAMLASVDPGKVGAAATAYDNASTATGNLANHILSVAEGLAKVWNGSDAAAAQDALRRLYATASELTRRMQQANQALSAHQTSLSTLKSQADALQPPVTNARFQLTAPTGTQDAVAQKIMQTYNAQTAIAWTGMPQQIQQNLPGLAGPIHGETPYASGPSSNGNRRGPQAGPGNRGPGYDGSKPGSTPPGWSPTSPGHRPGTVPGPVGTPPNWTTHLANWPPSPGAPGPGSPGPGLPGPSRPGPSVPGAPGNPGPGFPGPGNIGPVPQPGPGNRPPGTDVPPGDEPVVPGRTGPGSPFQNEEPPFVGRPNGLTPGPNLPQDPEPSTGIAEPGLDGPTGTAPIEEQSATLGAAETGGMSGMPVFPGGGGAGSSEGERTRSSWLPEERDTWATDRPYAPPVIGEQESRAAQVKIPDRVLGLDELQGLVDACVGELKDERETESGRPFELPEDSLSNLLSNPGFDG